MQFPRRGSSLRQRTARAKRSPTPAQAFFGELLQRLGSGGSSASSEWQSATAAATLQSRRPHVQEADVKLIKGLLEGCRQEEELRMPTRCVLLLRLCLYEVAERAGLGSRAARAPGLAEAGFRLVM